MGRFRGDEFPAFAEYDGFSIIENQKKRITLDINGQPDDYILNANKGEYIAHFISAYKIPPLEIHGDQLSVSTEERSIPAEMHPYNYRVRTGESYPKEVFTFHLPFTGNAKRLKARASTWSTPSPPSLNSGWMNSSISRY